MGEGLLAAVRCGCGGQVERWTEQTARGLRWVFVCAGCGSRWGHRDGVFGPLDQGDPIRCLDDGTPEESALLACFRQLPGPVRAELLSQVQALVRSTGSAP